jgi:hypothetical protein
MQQLTNSRRSAFARCHRNHQYQYEMARRPATTSDALRFGTLVHAGLEAWWSAPNDRLQSSVAAILCAGEADLYMVAAAVATLEVYTSVHAGHDYETVAVEKQYRAPLLNPVTCGQSQTWELVGKIDAIALDKASGKTVIVEHKTTSYEIGPDADYWDKLAIDGQVSGYFVGATSLGYDISDCLYDVIRKSAIRPLKATPPESRKYTKDGKLYAAQRETDETPEEYRQRYAEAIGEDTGKYFARRMIGRSEGDIVEYLSDMWAVGREIRDAQLDGRWPRNPSACEDWGGCPYFDVCAGRCSIDDDSRFTTTATNPELSKEATNA